VVGANRSLAELRSLQDWYIRFGVAKAPGVAEVASVGGFVRQYNVVVDPVKLRSFGVPLNRVIEAIRASNRETGGRVVEMAEAEFMVRGRGYLTGTADLEQIVLKADGPTSVLMRDVARIELGPDERRGVSELNGEGEAVGGIALQRFGQNALDVIDNVKARLRDIVGGLPEGVRIETVYDRSELIHRAIATLKSTLIEECLVVAAVCIVFLLHVRSALVAINSSKLTTSREDPLTMGVEQTTATAAGQTLRVATTPLGRLLSKPRQIPDTCRRPVARTNPAL
jgi:Cu(I)/Ag(I) efflux system membrane protein CusA/SilA